MNRASGKKGSVVQDSRGGSGKRAFYLVIVVLLIAGVATIGYQTMRPPAQAVFTMDSTVQLVANQGHSIGSDTALVEVIEFADFECPACGDFANITEPDVRSRLVNTGLIRYRFMDFPLEGHPNTRAAHMAAWCASEQNRFWEMHDAIFQSQDRWSGYATSRPLPVLEGLAQRVGVNVPQYRTCMETRKFLGQIQSNFDEGTRRGVGSTPTFFIGNTKVATNMHYDEFKRHVDAALAQARAARAAAPGTKGAAPGTKAAPAAGTKSARP